MLNNNGSQEPDEKHPMIAVRVKGTIQSELADWLEPDQIHYFENGDTEMVYTDLDQAGLYGILVRLRDLGLSLIGVEQRE